MKGKPKVLNTHGSLLGYKKYLPHNQHRPYKLYDALTFKASTKKANAIVVSSKIEYEDAIEFGIPKNKIHVIPMGVDVDKYSGNSTNKDTDVLNILFVGRVARVRRLEILLQAAAKLTIPFHITLVGGEEKTASLSRWGYMDELKELSQTLNIHNRITFVGPVSQGELPKWYNRGDIFVYPSLYENFGQPILEAAASGLPIISTPVGVAKEIIKDNETGFIFNGKSQELADRINLLKDHNFRKKMGSGAKEKVRNLFGWEKVINHYINLYQSL